MAISQSQMDVDALARARGLSTPEEYGQSKVNEAMQGTYGAELNDLNRAATENFIGGTSGLAAKGLSGGVLGGRLASLENTRQNALNDFQYRLNDYGQQYKEQESNRQNIYNSLIASINMSNLGDANTRAALQQQLAQAIASGSITLSEQQSLAALLSGKYNRLNFPSNFGAAGLQITPQQLGKGGFGEEFAQSAFNFKQGQGGQGWGGILGDVVTLGIPAGIRSIQNIMDGKGDVWDWVNVAGAAANFIPGVGLIGNLGKNILTGGAKAAGTSLAKSAATSLVDDVARAGTSVVDDIARAGMSRAGTSFVDDIARAGMSTVDDITRMGATVADDTARLGTNVTGSLGMPNWTTRNGMQYGAGLTGASNIDEAARAAQAGNQLALLGPQALGSGFSMYPGAAVTNNIDDFTRAALAQGGSNIDELLRGQRALQPYVLGQSAQTAAAQTAGNVGAQAATAAANIAPEVASGIGAQVAQQAGTGAGSALNTTLQQRIAEMLKGTNLAQRKFIGSPVRMGAGLLGSPYTQGILTGGVPQMAQQMFDPNRIYR